jgi:hypothetical protein
MYALSQTVHGNLKTGQGVCHPVLLEGDLIMSDNTNWVGLEHHPTDVYVSWHIGKDEAIDDMQHLREFFQQALSGDIESLITLLDYVYQAGRDSKLGK